MADISKINAVALANIAKLDAVLAANIAKVNGLVFTAAAGEFLLDTYTGAAAAYSVRRLATSATVLLRVRRDTAGGTGDDDEADVAYDSNNILSLDSAISNASVAVTATTLGQFLNVGTVGGTTYTNPDSLTVTASCFVDTWYDQAGSNDATQATESAQPQIHDGTVNTDLITENGKPALQYDGSDDFLTVPNDKTSFKFMHDGSFATIEGVARFGDSSNPDAALTLFDTGGLASNLRGAAIQYDDRSSVSRNNQMSILLAAGVTGDSNRPVQIQTDDKITPNQQTLVYATIDADNATADDRGKYAISGGTLFGGNTNTATPSTANSTADLHIGRYSQSNILQLLGTMQEFVLWDADHSASRSDIEENINSDYLIYQPTDQPTSGFLYTYGSQSGGTDAAAAYSVRQLSDKAVIALRIRRDSDDEEINIGWDSNGDLDTTAISDFCGTANGYVTRWWDQSTNGNHADQATDTSQPQIYNGTAVTTLNSKPSVTFSGFTFMSYTTWSPSSELSAFWVAQNEATVSSWTLVGPNNNQWAPISTSTFRTRITAFYTWAWSVASGAQYLAALIRDVNNDGEFHYNGNTSSTTRNFTDTVTLNQFGVNSNNNLDGGIQEVVFWSADQTDNRTGIETNINDYFSIY